MKVFSIIAQKGGVGKTTLALNLAIIAELDDKATAVFDTDPQASTAQWAEEQRESESPVFVKANVSNIKQKIRISKQAGADFIFIDTPPYSSSETLEFARVADHILIPVTPDYLALRALRDTIDIVKLARKPATIILNRMPPLHHKNRRNQAVEAAEGLGIEVCPNMINDRVIFRDSLLSGLGVNEKQPHGEASQEIQDLYNYITTKI